VLKTDASHPISAPVRYKCFLTRTGQWIHRSDIKISHLILGFNPQHCSPSQKKNHHRFAGAQINFLAIKKKNATALT
jgi:hypothetical protein